MTTIWFPAVDTPLYIVILYNTTAECCWVNMDFPRSCWPTRTLLIHAKPIAGCSPFKLAPYRLPCTGTETDDERRKNDDSVKNINSNKYCGDGDQKNNMPEEKELD